MASVQQCALCHAEEPALLQALIPTAATATAATATAAALNSYN
jgi:hypothetical protein